MYLQLRGINKYFNTNNGNNNMCLLVINGRTQRGYIRCSKCICLETYKTVGVEFPYKVKCLHNII